MDAREDLRQLILQAQNLLSETKDYTTKLCRLGLEDMVEQARLALDGKNEVPFTRKREFLVPRQDEACLFAAKRYTMVPTFLKEKSVYHTYGLADAIEWFSGCDMRKPLLASEIEAGKEGTLSEKEKFDFYLKQCRTMLKEAEDCGFGDKVGQYNKSAWEGLSKAVLDVEAIKIDEAAPKKDMGAVKKLIYCIDCLNELRFSRVLQSEKDDGGNLMLSGEEMEALREKIKTDPLTAAEYEKIKALADTAGLEERSLAWKLQSEQDDYQRMNEKFEILGGSGNLPSFSAPENSSYARLSMTLPSEDNEMDGLGHIWIDNFRIASSQGDDLSVHTGKLSFCNQTGAESAYWEYQENIPVDTDVMYTMNFDAKQDGKLKKGLKIALDFYDKENKKTGEHICIFNRKSWFNVKKYNLYAQCDAICYWYTKDKDYAKKAKIEILHFMDDFLQGAEHWLRFNSRPEGSDAYGGVQGGRDLFTLACAYSLIRDSGVFSKEEKDRFYSMVDYFLRYLSDLRDRMTLSPERSQRFTSNWQTDMCIGTAAMMMVLTDYPNRKVWMYNAKAVLRAQLDLKINPDGSWPESLRYHHAALEHFALYARLLKRESGEDWFAPVKNIQGDTLQESNLLQMFGYSLKTQTPPYIYFNSCIATPPFGDHKLGDGSEYAIYGIYSALVRAYDTKLADRMYQTWCLAKKPIKGYWGESMALENLMYEVKTNTDDKENKTGVRQEEADDRQYKKEYSINSLSLSSVSFPDAGLHIFRKDFGSTKQNYLAVMSSPKPVGHGHLDQGSFILYYHGIPLIMDSGIEGYFSSSTPWHLCSYSHAVMQFATGKKQIEKQSGGFINLTAGTYSLERGYADGPRNSRVTDLHIGDKKQEWITMEIENPEGEGIQKRTILTDHEKETWTVCDEVRNFEGRVLFSLPLLAEQAYIDGNTIYAKGYYGVDMEILFESKLVSLTIEEGRATPMSPDAKDCSMLKYIRATADAKEGFKAILKPYERENCE